MLASPIILKKWNFASAGGPDSFRQTGPQQFDDLGHPGKILAAALDQVLAAAALAAQQGKDAAADLAQAAGPPAAADNDIGLRGSRVGQHVSAAVEQGGGEETDLGDVEPAELADDQQVRLGAGGVDLEYWLDDVTEKGITSVLVEGGGEVATSFISGGIFGRLVLCYAPAIGGGEAVSWYQRAEPPAWLADEELALSRLEALDNDVAAVYDSPAIAGYLETVTEEEKIVHWAD